MKVSGLHQGILVLGSLLTVFLLQCCATPSVKTINFAEQGADTTGKVPCQETLRRTLALLDRAGGGTVYFPEGTYLFTDRVELPSRVRLVGAGRSSTLKLADAAGGATRIPKGGFLARGQTDLAVQNLSFDLNAGQNFATWLAFREVTNITVQNCFFYNSNQAAERPEWTLHGILCANVDGAQIIGNESDGCQFKMNGGAGYARNMVIRSNRFRNCAQMGVSVVNRIDEGQSVDMTNIQIVDNSFARIDDHAIYVGHDHGKEGVEGTMVMEDILIEGNTILDPGLYPGGLTSGIFVRMTAASRGVSIKSNRIIYQGERRAQFSYGIRLSGGSGSVPPGFEPRGAEIATNVLTGGDQAGIQLVGQRQVLLRNNEIRNVSRAIQLRDCSEINVLNNFIDGVTTGVEIEDSGEIRITENRIRGYTRGLFLLGEGSSEPLLVSFKNNAFSLPRNNGKRIVRRSGNYRVEEGLRPTKE